MLELGQWQARTLFCLNNMFGLNRLLLHFFSPITKANKYSKTFIQLNFVKTHESFGPKYEWSRCFLRECRRQLFGIESGQGSVAIIQVVLDIIRLSSFMRVPLLKLIDSIFVCFVVMSCYKECFFQFLLELYYQAVLSNQLLKKK